MQAPMLQTSSNKDQQTLEAEEPEQKKMGLYQIIFKRREEDENPPVARLLYCAFFNESFIQQNNIETADKMEEIIKKNNEPYKNNFTGFYLVKNLFAIHMLEGDSTLLNHFLTQLYKELKKEKTYYQMVNVIAFNEENPTRMYDKWYSDSVQFPGPTLSLDIEKTDQQAQDRTWEIYNNFCEAGKRHAQKVHKDKHQKKLAQEINITTDDMSMLFMKRFMSLEDYYNLYLEDIEIRLDREVQYPYNPPLTKYLEYFDKGYMDLL